MPGFHHSIAVSPFPLAIAVSVHRCRCRCREPCLVGIDDWLASYVTTATEKIELDPRLFQRLRQLFAVHGCNGTEFSYAEIEQI